MADDNVMAMDDEDEDVNVVEVFDPDDEEQRTIYAYPAVGMWLSTNQATTLTRTAKRALEYLQELEAQGIKVEYSWLLTD